MHNDRPTRGGSRCDEPSHRDVRRGQAETCAGTDRDCQLIFCPRCGATIKETVTVCPVCGAATAAI